MLLLLAHILMVLPPLVLTHSRPQAVLVDNEQFGRRQKAPLPAVRERGLPISECDADTRVRPDE
jgi:hypothetical protein